jgi:hypothetical protein
MTCILATLSNNSASNLDGDQVARFRDNGMFARRTYFNDRSLSHEIGQKQCCQPWILQDT